MLGNQSNDSRRRSARVAGALLLSSALQVLPLMLQPSIAKDSPPQGEEASDLSASVVAGPVGPRRQLGSIGYVAPAGWSVKTNHGAIEMHPGSAPTNTPCVALLLPPRPAQNDLASQAEGLVNQLFAARFHGPMHAEPAGDVKADKYSRYDGVSATGWHFVDLYGKLGDRRVFVYAHVLLARMENQVVPMIGLTDSGDRCMGGHDHATWVLLFHSLRLPGFEEENNHLKKPLVGSWTSVNSTVYVNEAFSANGHFGDVGGHSTYKVNINHPDVILQETSTWLGDGTYEVHGDRLTTVSKSRNGGQPITNLISIVRRPNREKQGGFELVLRTVQKGEGAVFVGTLTKD